MPQIRTIGGQVWIWCSDCCVVFVAISFPTILLPTMRFPHLLLAVIATLPHLTDAYMQERLVKSAPGPSDSCSSATSDVSSSTTATTTTKNATNANDQSECNVNANDSQRYGDTDISSMSDTDFGVAQTIEGDHSSKIIEVIEQSKMYMSTVVNVDPAYDTVRDECRNHEPLCSFWSTLDECDKNPAYMKLHCGPACQSCEQLDINVRCPMDPNVKDALGSGDLNQLFERIVSDPYYQQYQPNIGSRPSHPPHATEAERQAANYTIGPWVIIFDSFLSDKEADNFIRLASIEGYVRSTDVGGKKFDGTYGDVRSSKRTSENSWCQHECFEDTTTKQVLSRIANLTGIDDTNSEYLQLLKYEEGQFYGVHNDFIPHQVTRPVGPRILTFYMYLNDVEDGGGTRFPAVGAQPDGTTVIPKRGRAVLWPSVLDSDPKTQDSRTNHEALPVIKGVKYGANAWIHNRNYKGPNVVGCT